MPKNVQSNIHYTDVIMGAMASQIISLTIVYSTVYSGTYQRKHQCSTSLAFVRGIHLWPVNSPHKGPVTRKMFQFDDVIMITLHNKSAIQFTYDSLPLSVLDADVVPVLASGDAKLHTRVLFPFSHARANILDRLFICGAWWYLRKYIGRWNWKEFF